MEEERAVAAYLRDRQASNGEAGDDVGLEEGETVSGAPLEDGEEVLEGQSQLPEGGLSSELVEGVVGEEDLSQAVPQGLEEAPRRRRGNPAGHNRLKVDDPREVIYPVGAPTHLEISEERKGQGPRTKLSRIVLRSRHDGGPIYRAEIREGSSRDLVEEISPLPVTSEKAASSAPNSKWSTSLAGSLTLRAFSLIISIFLCFVLPLPLLPLLLLEHEWTNPVGIFEGKKASLKIPELHNQSPRRLPFPRLSLLENSRRMPAPEGMSSDQKPSRRGGGSSSSSSALA